jgi:apolipoprotein N-acyltransferase
MIGSISSMLGNRYLVAMTGGLLLGVSLPKIGLAGFAWIAPALMLFAAAGLRGWASFRVGYLGGVIFWLVSLYWLLLIPFPAGAVAGWAALCAFLGLYSGSWVWLSWKLFPGSRDWPKPENLAEALGRVAEASWAERLRWNVLVALGWVGLEMIMARLFSGFPWNFAGVSQYQMVPLIQIVAITGIYGVTFLLVWFSVSLGCALILLARKPLARRLWSAELALPMLVTGLVYIAGYQHLGPLEENAPKLKVAMIQPSIPQTLIWDPSADEDRFAALMRLSEEALEAKPDLLIWPEAALPGFTEARFQAMKNLIREHQVWMIFGADDADVVGRADGVLQTNYYNSSFLFDPTGRYVSAYRKRRLVIFGEYIPLGRWLPFMKYLTPIQGGFAAGERVVRFDLPELQTSLAVLICFEDVFPHYTREHADEETDFLLNLTNNGWFGESAAQWQHAANAVFRAVENGLPLVRCTNNGLTCWIDRRGRMREVFRGAGGSVYEAGYLVAEIPLRAPAAVRGATIYRRYGDWFGWLALGVTAGILAARLLRDRRARPPQAAEVRLS